MTLEQRRDDQSWTTLVCGGCGAVAFELAAWHDPEHPERISSLEMRCRHCQITSVLVMPEPRFRLIPDKGAKDGAIPVPGHLARAQVKESPT